MNASALNPPIAAEERIRKASEWLMRLQGDSVPEAEVHAWLNWCAADAENLRAFEDVRKLYKQLQGLNSTDRQSFISLANVDVRRVINGVIRRFAVLAFARGGRAVAATIAVSLLVVGGVFGRWHLSSSTVEAHDYQVARGFQKSLILADRSRVTLASASEMSSNFTTDTRYLELRTGEAYFEVNHDRDWPFVVRAGPLTVTAVGTKFDIRRVSNRTIVVVTEGAVDVTTEETVTSPSPLGVLTRNKEEATTTVRVHAGQQAIRAPMQRGLNVSDVNSVAAIAWRYGRLEYIMEPLGSVVEDVNRYTSRRIVISDARLSDLVFTGTVFRDHVDDWARTLPSAFPIRATISADGTTIRLEAQTSKPAAASDMRR